MPLMERHRRAGEQGRPGYAVFETGRTLRKKRRFWVRLFVYALLLALVAALGGFAYLSASILDEAGDEPSEQQQAAVEQEEVSQETATEEEEEAVSPAPEDPTLYLTVPRLGIYGHTVRNDRSEEAMGLGAIKLPDTGFPWQKGDTNTYIACHRIGFPGTESFNQCIDLTSMQQGDEIILEDAIGGVYSYRVSEFLRVAPGDTWVTEPVEGRDVVSLQTCIENLNDLFTLGPNWEARYIVQADRVG
jgi:sortase A